MMELHINVQASGFQRRSSSQGCAMLQVKLSLAVIILLIYWQFSTKLAEKSDTPPESFFSF